MMKSGSLLLLFSLTLAAPPTHAAPDVKVDELLDRIDDMWRGDSSEAKFSMKVKTANYERSMVMRGWSKGKDRTLIRMLAPLKEKGSATLKSGETIYTYLPKTDRTIRLTSGMMGGSWMGSHFTNDDLVKESRLRDDYDPKITFQGERKGKGVIEIALIPKPDAAVVWGKIVTIVDAKTLLPVESLYYDEDMKVTRRATFTDTGKLGGRSVPTVMTIIPEDKPKEFTRITYEKLELNVDISDNFFSVSRLKRR
jgi:outer membrane lipoprotein-sorting protein